MKADRLLAPRWLLELWKFKVAPGGLALLLAILMAGLGTVSVLIPVYQIFMGLVTLYVLCWATAWLFSPRVKVTGRFPEKTSVGQPVVGEFVIANQSRWPVYDLMLTIVSLPKPLRMQYAEETVPALPGKDSVTMRLGLTPLRRGLYPLPPLRPHSTFPFNIGRSGTLRHPLGTLLALPAFHPLTNIQAPVGHRYQPGGIALTSHVGESPEYIGNREYIPGEPARRLDFRSWARLGKPVVREYQEEYYCRIALILDTFLPPAEARRWLVKDAWGNTQVAVGFGSDGLLTIGADALPQGHPLMEAGVSLAAAIAAGLSGGEYIIDLFAAGPELYVFRSGRHTAHLENVLEILACVDHCPTDPFEKIAPAISEELSTISTAICVFLDWDEARQSLCRTIQEAGCSLKTLVVRQNLDTPLDQGDVLDFTELTVAQILHGKVDEI